MKVKMQTKSAFVAFFAAAASFSAALAEPSARQRRPEFVMPDEVYAAPGVECNVYFHCVLDSVQPMRYAFEARCRVGTCENERWTWTPKAEDAGKSERLVLNAWSDDGLVCCRTVMVQVASAKADPSRRVTCAILGDSLTNSRFQDRIMAVVREAGWSGYTPVGLRPSEIDLKHGASPDAARHDGYGGYSPEAFLSRYAFSEDELENAKDDAEREQMRRFVVRPRKGAPVRKALLKSPIVRFSNGEKTVDVQAWLDRVNGGEAPDFVLIELGTNGPGGKSDDEIAAYCESSQVAPMRRLVKLIRAAAPRAKIAIATCTVGTMQDAFGKNYGSGMSSVQFRKNMHFLTRRWMALVKEFNDAGDANVFIAPFGQAINPVYGYPRQSAGAFAHSKAPVQRAANAVHPTVEGGMQLGDALAAWLLCNMGK